MGTPQHKDGSLDWTTVTTDYLLWTSWIFNFWIFFFFFKLDTVLLGTPNTALIDEGGPRYFGTSL